MATIVCHHQQQGSCTLEPKNNLAEPRTTLRLRLSPSPSTLTAPPQQKCTNAVNGGGWSFLQSLSHQAPAKPAGEEETTYVHPLNKRSSSTVLSKSSLMLCTENLGNETGITDSDDLGILSNTWCAAPKSDFAGEEVAPARRSSPARRTRVGPRSFPPPLTTMAGKDSIQVRTHREEGRLVITTVKGPSRLVSCFRADRSEEGRLKLCLIGNYSPNFDSSETEKENEKESFENDVKLEEEEEDLIKKEEEEEEGEEEEVKKEKDVKKVGESLKFEKKKGESENIEKIKGESEKERGEMVIIEKFGIGRGRCKESGEQQYKVENKRALNWEPFWVAT